MCSLGYCHAFLLSTAGVDGTTHGGIGGWQSGGIRSIFCVYSRGFPLMHSPMEPATGLGVQGGLCRYAPFCEGKKERN
jgi:hypothetical protein